jgi:hypothetical protein
MALSNQARDQIIDQLLKTGVGRSKLAKTMQQPLRLRRDYLSIARKTFVVEDLPRGALAVYDKDPEVNAFVVGEEGENILSIQKSKRVIFPLFEIASNPEIPFSQINERRFDLITRSQDLARAQIGAAEDERAFAIMDSIALSGFDGVPGQTNPDLNVVAPIDPSILADAFAEVERHGLRVARIFMNAIDYADIRKFGRDILDPVSQGELLKTGLQVRIWGADILTSRLVPPGFVYICAEPENFGRIPVRTELSVISADKPSERMIGFSCFENLGLGAFNPLALTRVVVSRF